MTNLQPERIWLDLSASLFEICRKMEGENGSNESRLEPMLVVRNRSMITLQLSQAARSVNVVRRVPRAHQQSQTFIVSKRVDQRTTSSEKWYLTINADGEIRKGTRLTSIATLAKDLVLLLYDEYKTRRLEEILDQRS